MKYTNLLLLGSSGFIGKNLLAGLRKKYNIYHPTHKEVDLLDAKTVETYFVSHKIDVVIYCAVVGGSRKEEYIDNAFYISTRMFFNIIRNKKHFKKMIFLGSGIEYDKSRPLVKVKEEEFDTFVPQDEYGFHKYVCSKFIEQVDYIVNLRIFGMFGKHEDYSLRFISNAMCRSIFGLPIEMNQDVYFDYVYIDDFIIIVEYFINHDATYKFYNIGRGTPINLLTIAEKINLIADYKSKIIVLKAGLNNEYTCDNSRLMQEIPNLKFTDFDCSLKDFYLWYKSIKKSLNKEMFIT